MSDWLKDYIEQIKEIWAKLNKRTKIIIGISTFILITAFIFIIFSGGPDYQVLFNQLDPADANAIIEELEGQGISYQLRDGGRTILVPANQVYKTRLNMAGKGLPTQGVVGFEIFNQSSFGTTDFERNVNYYRALNGELSRSIQALDVVEHARVQITAPRESLFIEEEKNAEASVLLKLAPNYNISKEQIKAIARLVASAVPGLDPENVTIVDTAGNLLSDLIYEDELSVFNQRLTLTQFELQNQLSNQIRNDLIRLLSRVLGPDNFTVHVKVKLNFDQREVESKLFSPVVGDEGIVRSQQESRENYQGSTSQAIGVPGTTSNIPQYQSIENGEGIDTYSSYDSITNYEINEVIERRVYSPGNIESIATAVIVNNSISEENLEKLRSAIEAAVAYNPERGDTLMVTALNFDRTLEEEITFAQAAELAAQRQRLLIYAGLIAFIFIILLLLSLSVLRGRQREEEEREQVLDLLVDGELDEEIAIGLESELSDEQKKRREILKQLTELINEQPEEVTQIIKSWLLDE
ncbi:MAG TPA: flagellar M-ring protein FliF [Halanaerobiaceae bacterium]|jgi:flagellar M-ring protein FliF|nr:flagellar basal-body MS-ring/collar protein FliF [Bacillota bacterium]HHU92557.1 flagellar M-ring protein FliF [Halanaerobiaceae bacterium]HOA40579.1 flagellar basal-body MS-ring/collar protein FliF [Halanaerobiales bacterium]HPZ63055.1 flagellar basal-body MS-ring/collar protein FliF [Halanaerobiales bacterium]HQD04019.1 flagellar basal-body MS-ring/collar protein FliF [Halanaerobiales bacterium]